MRRISMPETDEQPEDGLDDLEKAGRVNFRDYPSSGLVVIAALSSGLGWMLFKWLGKKRKSRNAGQAENTEETSASSQASPPADPGT
jgi:hypothetical protein